MSDKKIVVGVTASIDSIATVLLLKLQGYEIFGIHILFSVTDADNSVDKSSTTCLNQSNKELLEQIFSELSLPLYFVDQQENFSDTIVSNAVLANFMKEFYAPCIACHKIKLLSLYEKMLKLDANHLATGHYAKLRKAGQEGLVSLYASSNKELDQHKYLSAVDQTILDKLILPLSDLNKEKVISIVKQHLPKYFQKLTNGVKQNFCPILKDSREAIKKVIPPSMNRKSRLFSRDTKTFLNESYDNSEFEFGKVFKMGSAARGKDQQLAVTGFNYSYQTIYVNEQPAVGVNYFFVQIAEFFGKPNFYEPMQAIISINDDSESLPAVVYFKGLNYVLVLLKNGNHPYVPAKSLLFIHEETRQGKRLTCLTKIVSQGKTDKNATLNPIKLAKIEGDFPF